MEHPKEYSETGNISQRITEALDLTLSGLGYSTRVSWHMVKCLARETFRQRKSRTRNLWREKTQLRHCFSAIGIESLRFLILYDVIGFHCWVLRSYLTKLLILLTLFSHSATLRVLQSRRTCWVVEWFWCENLMEPQSEPPFESESSFGHCGNSNCGLYSSQLYLQSRERRYCPGDKVTTNLQKWLD